ncbi:MAG: hypothetical protein ACOVP7_03725 [Lacibacter sp.]
MKTEICLKQVVAHVATALLPIAVLRNSFFVNDVAPDVQLASDETVVASAIKKLLLEEVLHTHDACIRISASTEKGTPGLMVHKKGPFALPLT